jgi:hypothetical protein
MSHTIVLSLQSVLPRKWQSVLLLLVAPLLFQTVGCARYTTSATNATPSISPFAITTSKLPSGATEGAYSANISAFGGKAPYTWSLLTGQLPSGLNISSALGAISGKPTEAGTWTFAVQAQDSSSPSQTATMNLTILISSPVSALQITTTSLADGRVGANYASSVSASGGTPPYSWSMTDGSLPAGLAFNETSGQISGTATKEGAFPIILEVTDSSAPTQTAKKNLAMVISGTSGMPVSITTTSLPAAQQGAMYSAIFTASGGTLPYGWLIAAGSLPSGLSLDGLSGQISGTPTEEGVFPITVQVKDASSPAQVAFAALNETVNGTSSGDCPTGQPCGASAPYCENYTPPSTSGAALINSLPYRITSPGNYYLDSDLGSTGVGIAVLASNVDINLNGHTITYGTVANGSGPTAIGEYGILSCSQGSTLDASYQRNGFCVTGGISPGNLTIENGAIVQSPNASQYYDPDNCPGSGVGSGSEGVCFSHHESVASDVINIQTASSVTIRHLTLTWQNVDSDGAHLNYQWKVGTGDVVECNTFNNEVQLINDRSYPRGASISDMSRISGQLLATYRYNTFVGAPQQVIALGFGWTPAVIEYNDINAGYYQAPPYTSQLKAYSNDYSITCPAPGLAGTPTIAYNYIHNTNGRGIGCIYDGDEQSMQVHDNYVVSTEAAGNGEYGPNGSVNGGTWVGGCEIDGSRGFEAKGSTAIGLYNNTFIVNVGACGGGGIVFTGFQGDASSCSCIVPSSAPFNVHDNTIQVVNTSGGSIAHGDAACYVFDESQGTFSNIFTPFLRDNCTTDGDYVTSNGYQPGDYFSFYSPTWARGTHPLSSGCGGTAAQDACGYMMHWLGVSSPPADELGYVFQDVSLGSGASVSFYGEHYGGSPAARSATVQWTYTPTVINAATANPIAGATVSTTDGGGRQSSCTTNASGQCVLELRQEVVSSPAGDATLTTRNENPTALTIAAPGCTSLNFDLIISQTTTQTQSLICQ